MLTVTFRGSRLSIFLCLFIDWFIFYHELTNCRCNQQQSYIWKKSVTHFAKLKALLQNKINHKFSGLNSQWKSLKQLGTIVIFLEKLCYKYGGETSPRPFSEKLKLIISLDQQCKVLYSLFLLYGKLRSIKIYWN